jgi:hypothetical protein
MTTPTEAAIREIADACEAAIAAWLAARNRTLAPRAAGQRATAAR